MKVLFINPKQSPNAMNFAHCMDLAGAKSSHIPLGLATLAALTPSFARVAILDENIEPLTPGCDADIVAITGMLSQRNRVLKLAREYKAMGKHVAIGGPMTFDLAGECEKYSDTVFVGEADLTWPEFIEDFRSGSPKRLYSQKGRADVNKTPLPRYDLLKTRLYASASIQATRGCPYRCDFCDIPVRYGDAPRSKDIGLVIAELKAISRLGFDSVFFVDDNFAGDKIYAKKLLREIAKVLPALSPRPYFYTQATLDVAEDEEMLLLFRKAGFQRLFIGIETFDEASLLRLNKGHNARLDMEAAVRRISSHGITVWASLMFGLENRAPATFDEEVSRLLGAGAVPLQVGLLQAVPGTPLHERALREKRFVEMPSVIGSVALSEPGVKRTTNLVHDISTEKDLNSGLAKSLKALFEPDAYARVLIKNAKKSPRNFFSSMPRLNANNIGVVGRTLWYYLFTAEKPARKMFLNVLKGVLFSGMRNADEVIYHLVIYKHLRKHYLELAGMCEARGNENMPY
ncbi:MAG: radical SAM protein [Thermodesulfobacteriota bacterium]